MNSVHPIELITQEVIEEPLESLNMQLMKLYDSQLLILSLLQSYEQKLTHYAQVSQERQQNTQMLIKTYKDRIYHLKLKLLKISKVLNICNSRVDKVMLELIDSN